MRHVRGKGKGKIMLYWFGRKRDFDSKASVLLVMARVYFVNEH